MIYILFMTESLTFSRAFKYIIALLIAFYSLSFAEIPQDIRKNVIAATVYLVPYDNELGLFRPWSGSGVIISPSGYIVTNYHVIGDDLEQTHDDYHAVYVSDPNKTYELPKFKYWARFVVGSPEYDLAIIKIIKAKDGSALKTKFPSVAIADAMQLVPGDDLTIVGYPAVSGDTISVTSGEMSGWLGEDQLGAGSSWIKTDTKISGGNSGGAALNPAGELIGIPTQFYFDDGEQVGQGYIRPLNLLWGYIAAYVKDATVADERIKLLMLEQKADQEIKAVRFKTPLRRELAEAEASDSEYKTIKFDHEISRYIAGDDRDYVYHLYKIKAAKGTKAVTISLDGKYMDLDLAVRVGEKIHSYDKTDFSDFSEKKKPFVTIFEPNAQTIYIDVVNSLDADAFYSLVVTKGIYDTALDMIDAMPSGDYGYLAPNRSFKGKLEKSDGAVVYHSFTVAVPRDRAITVSLDGFGDDVDIAIREESAMIDTSYADAEFLDKSDKSKLEYTLDNVKSGLLFIDVLSYIDKEISYSLKVTTP